MGATGPTIRQARYLIAVADAGTYKKAAALVADGANSRGAMRLVKRFGDTIGSPEPLVSADRRGNVRLTETGRDVLPLARRVVDAADALRDAGVTPLFSSYPVIAARLIAARPELLEDGQLALKDVHDSNRAQGGIEIVRRVAEGNLDIAVAPSRLANRFPDLTERPLYSWGLRIALPRDHALADVDQVSPHDLTDLRFVATPPFHRSRQLLESAFTLERLIPEILMESRDQTLLLEIAQNSQSLAAAIPDDVSRPDGKIDPLLVSRGQAVSGAYSVYYRAGTVGTPTSRRRTRINELVEEIVRLLGDLTLDEVADELGCSRSHVDAIIGAGDLPILQLSPDRAVVSRWALNAYLRRMHGEDR
jgi:DNA-binding transcriptional LysR family regulator